MPIKDKAFDDLLVVSQMITEETKLNSLILPDAFDKVVGLVIKAVLNACLPKVGQTLRKLGIK